MRLSQLLISISDRMCAVSNRVGAAAIVVIAIAGTASPQTGRVAPPAIKDPKGETVDRQNREATLRSAETEVAVEKTDQRRINAAIEQIKEDFKRIQIVRNEIVHNLLANKPPDYRLISEQAGDVRKRADRLKASFGGTARDDAEKSQKTEIYFDDKEMKSALVRLCNLIIGFVESPAVKSPGTTDVRRSKEAARDLLTIIDISNDIKKSADKLSTSSK